MNDEVWAEASFEGAERAQRRRVAGWTPQERLAWVEAAVVEAERSGLLAQLRERKNRALLSAWYGDDSAMAAP